MTEGNNPAVAVSVNQVRNIIVNTELTDAQIEGGISTATIIVLENLMVANLATSVITEITTYLAAHFVSLRDKTTRIVREKIGDAEVEYEASKPSAGYTPLDSTEWGATALLLDTSGILLSLGKLQPRLISIGDA